MRLNVIYKTAFEEKENEVRYHDLCFYDHYRQERDQKVSPSLEVEIKVNEDIWLVLGLCVPSLSSLVATACK